MKKENIVLDSWIADIITKDNKDCIIVDVDFYYGGNIKVVYAVRINDDKKPLFKYVKPIYDCDLKDYKFK